MFSPDILNNFWSSISIMVKGMGGIFIFMFVFYLLIQLIDKFFPKEAESKEGEKK